MEEKKSKSGNMMFEITVALDTDPSVGCICYAVAEEGKRWFLKQLLQACDIQKDENGLYNFDTDYLIGKIVSGKVRNETETFINRDRQEETKTKAKIVAFKKRG